MAEKDKRDEIISMQLDLIRQMTQNNIRRLSDDIWGASRNPQNPQTAQNPQKSQGGKPQISAENRSRNPQSPSVGAANTGKPPETKASDGGDGGSVTEKEEELPPKESMQALEKELAGYIGLAGVKKEVENLINMAMVYQMRREHGLPNTDMSLHMVFSGNPGTGKTMIARFMARVYHSLGILSKGQLVEVDRSGLVAGYIGQTAIKTAKVLESAMGGVLFIDEAYTLTSKSENDFGFEAVDTILKAMEDNRDDLVVIVAGYTELMEEFVDSNPGLRSRFNKYLDFADYTAEEMCAIFALQCKKSQYTLDPDAEKLLKDYFGAVSEAAGEFGNARGVRNTFEKVLTAQANRIAHADSITRETLMQITKADAAAATGLPMEEPCVEKAPDNADRAPDASDKAPEKSDRSDTEV